ncbi:hypothetical protein PEBR_34529 [Penicillium brasilianum]|uniref:CENP-V/GFA domain-containing protein n=1 Tax=Penicillium brasilianum TaxID=104259 RepID=A0A1S9RDJ5_PENBI|nr:hypothetical protein PEBR_34529 [Penicillium brasilianum]
MNLASFFPYSSVQFKQRSKILKRTSLSGEVGQTIIMAPTYLTGACLCKSIAYRITLPTPEPLPKVDSTHQILLPPSETPSNKIHQIIICHCINCKRYTGSGFSANIIVPQSSFKYTQGSPQLYLDGSDKGGVVYREFCPDCGTPFTSRSDDDEDEVAVKSGTLNDEDRERSEQGPPAAPGVRSSQWWPGYIPTGTTTDNETWMMDDYP